MAKIVIEVQKRGLYQYHKPGQFPVTIGRALDNDVILSDGAVSPHHLRIEQEEDGKLYMHNLSEENGTLMNGHQIGSQRTMLPVPSRLVLGSRRVNVLSSDMEVASTNLLKFGSFFSILAHPAWVAVLLFLTGMALFVEKYLNTYVAQGTWFYASDVLLNLAVLGGIALILSVVTWVVSHRWVFVSALGIVALLMLFKSLLGLVGGFLNYFFTSDAPQELMLTLYNVPLVTLLLYFYQRWASYLRPSYALGVALLLSLPLVVLELFGLMDQQTISGEFNPDPVYNQTLSSFNIHSAPTLSLDDYMKSVKEALPSQLDE